METNQTRPVNSFISHQLHIVNGHDIYMKDIPPLKWLVKPVLHEGATLLSGDPKTGKSFLSLQIAIAVASTADTVCGSLEVGLHGRVLYLALDDGSERRIQERLRGLGADEETVKNIDFVYQRNIPSLSEGFDTVLENALNNMHYVLVVLDTLGTVLDAKQNKSNVYRSEYQEAIKLQKIAQKKDVCLLIVHHTNKGQGSDPVSRSSGSHGITGAVDSVWILTKENGGTLRARPRDWEESQHLLKRAEGGGWRVVQGRVPTPLKVLPTKERSKEMEEVLKLLKDGPKSSAEIAAALGIEKEAARKTRKDDA